MKIQIKQLDANQKIAHIILLTVCVAICHLVYFIIWKAIISNAHIVPNSPSAIGVAIVAIIGWVIFPLAVYTGLLFAGYEKKIYTYLVKKDEARKQQLIIQKENARQEILNARFEYQENGYIIRSVAGVANRTFVFGIQFDSKIFRQALPLTHINNRVVPIEVLTETTALCFAKDAISSENKKLYFSVGKNSFPISNPYFMDMDCNPKIQWQNQGHTHEKKILIPKELFPFAVKHITYPFQMYIDGNTHTSLNGHYDSTLDCIVIPLGDKVFKKQCTGKSCSLRASFGRGNQLVLPAPTLLS